MEILKDECLVLKKKLVNESNVSLVLFTKKYGKINALMYKAASSKKIEKIAYSPGSYCYIELKKINDNNIIANQNLKKIYKNIYSNLEKLQISFYILSSLNQILEYNCVEESIYETVNIILDFLENIENEKLDTEKFIQRYLKRIIKEYGIYEKSIDNLKSIHELELYINEYLNVKLDYDKINLI